MICPSIVILNEIFPFLILFCGFTGTLLIGGEEQIPVARPAIFTIAFFPIGMAS